MKTPAPKQTPSLDLSSFIDAHRAPDAAARLAPMLSRAYADAQAGKRAHTLHAIRFGLLAIAAKEIIPRGEFGPWLDAVILEEASKVTPVSPSPEARKQRRSRYMRVAARFSEDVPIRSEGSLFLHDGMLDDPTDTLREAVEKWVGDRSLTEIYEDEGVLRERTKHQSHTPSSRTPEQTEQMTFDEVCRTWTDIKSEILVHGLQAKSWAVLPKADREALLDDLVTLTSAIRESLKA